MADNELARILAGTLDPRLSLGGSAESALRGASSGRVGSFARPIFNASARDPLNPTEIEIVEPPPRNVSDLWRTLVFKPLGDRMRAAQQQRERDASSKSADEALRQFYQSAPLP